MNNFEIKGCQILFVIITCTVLIVTLAHNKHYIVIKFKSLARHQCFYLKLTIIRVNYVSIFNSPSGSVTIVSIFVCISILLPKITKSLVMK